MHPTLPSRLALLALGCALLSAGFWGWSRRLPEPNWELSTAIVAPAPAPASSPAAAVAVVSAPAPKPTAKPLPPKRVVPSPTPAVAQAATVVPVPDVTSPPAASPVVIATPTVVEAAPSVVPAAPAVVEAAPAVVPEVPAIVPAATPDPTPRPSDAELAGPLPEPALGATPAATPSSMEISEIARQPQLWPAQVLLTSTQRFPVVIKGVNVGNMQVPAGRAVTLRKVNADGTLEIEFQGSPAKVKAQATDLAIRATALAASREKAAPAF